MKMTVKQKRFADYYIECGNATEAAIRAGYSKKTAGVIGSENLKKPYISEHINKRLKELESKRIATIEEVMQFLTSVMRGEERDQFDLDPALKDRIDASEKLAKRIEKTNGDVDTSINITFTKASDGYDKAD